MIFFCDINGLASLAVIFATISAGVNDWYHSIKIKLKVIQLGQIYTHSDSVSVLFNGLAALALAGPVFQSIFAKSK